MAASLRRWLAGWWTRPSEREALLAAVEAMRDASVAHARASEAHAVLLQQWIGSFATAEAGSSQVVTPQDELEMQSDRDLAQLKKAGFPLAGDAVEQDRWLLDFMAHPLT